jgi:hypothetical protein
MISWPHIVLEMIYYSPKALGGRRMELVEDVKELLMETAKSLKGSARRLFMDAMPKVV